MASFIYILYIHITIYLNLDFVLKSFRCSKTDVCGALCDNFTKFNSQNCCRKKLGD